MMLGVHCSVKGGLENAFTEAAELGIDTFQIFTRNQRQWKAKPIQPEEQEKFATASKASNVGVKFSHTSYLINLASDNPEIWQKSKAALKAEVERCHLLGLQFAVLHPGAAGKQTFEEAMSNLARGLREILEETAYSDVKIALENTAGQGSSIGGPFENLRMIYDRVESDRIGYTIDTCHAFVQGYDIRTQAGCEDMVAELEKFLTLNNILAFHLNDSKGDLGSHLDRHEHIGHGKLGLEPFRLIMKHFKNLPKVIETPKEDDWDQKNLAQLRELL